MPSIDVTRVLSNPRFADTITVYRLTQTIDNNGIASNTQVATPTSAVVFSQGGAQLFRLAEGEKITDRIGVVTAFRLNDGTAGSPADEVLWNGKRYTVTKCNNWTHYGAGFSEAVCTLISQAG